jgi:hypothetical protein
MPGSTDVPAFGQVWRYTGAGSQALYMLVAREAPKPGLADLGYWKILYMGAALLEARVREGRDVLDRMAGLPGPQQYVDAGWERVA